MINRTTFMPRGFHAWKNNLGFGARAEIQLASWGQKALCVVPGTINVRARLEKRIEFLQEDPFALRRELEKASMRCGVLEGEVSAYKRLFEDSPIAFHTLDRQGRITSVNKHWLELLGYTMEEVVGREIFGFILPEHEQQENARARFFARTSDQPIPDKSGERIYLAKDGHQIRAITFNTDFRSADKQVTQVLTAFLDVTGLREVEEELKKARAEIIQNERYAAVAQLAAVMSHSINNVLGGAIANVDELRRQCLAMHALLEVDRVADQIGYPTGKDAEGDIRRYLSELRQHIRGLEGNLASMSHAAVRTLDLAKARVAPEKPTSVLQAIEEAVSSQQDLANAYQVTIVLKNINLVPETGSMINKADLVDVFQNLIKNAIEAYVNGKANLPDKKVIITAKDTNARQIAVMVADQGVGISAQRKEELLRDSIMGVESYKVGSSGLGFLAVKMTVKQAGGWVDIISELGQGTKIGVRIPRAKEAAAISETVEAAPGISGVIKSRLQQLKVMLIDDQQDLREYLGSAMRNLGIIVVPMESPEVALQAYQRMNVKPHIIITDMNMPGMSGIELIRRIRETAGENPPRCLLYSGYLDDAVKEQLTEQAVRFFSKPIPPGDFLRIILSEAEAALGISFRIETDEEMAEHRPFTVIGRETARRIKEQIGSFTSWFALPNGRAIFEDDIDSAWEEFKGSVIALERLIENPIILPQLRDSALLQQALAAIPAGQRRKLSILYELFLDSGLREVRDGLAGGWRGLSDEEIQLRTEKAYEMLSAAQLLPLGPEAQPLVEKFVSIYDLLNTLNLPAQ